MTHVFAYGSNLDSARMVGRVPSATAVGGTDLAGFELRFHKRGWMDGTGKADAFWAGGAGAVIHGVVYEVDEAELADLDVHETGYERRLVGVTVATPDGSRYLEAWIYLARPDVIDGGLLPTGWYRDHILRGAREHHLPEALITWLEAHPTQE